MLEPAAPRIALRQLPLAARLVLSVFLIAVGLGYFSAMIQLHMKHSKKEGEPLPTPADVVEVFAGLKLYDPNEKLPCSQFESLLMGDKYAAEVSKSNMAPAFFAKSKGWAKERSQRGLDVKKLEAEHQGELDAMLAWIRSDAEPKEASYKNDSFPRPAKIEAITPEFLGPDGGVKVKSLIEARCQNCHANQAPSLANYDELKSRITPPSQEIIDGKWVRTAKQPDIERLTQSTHAHLLTFAVLFAMTGLTFAFTSYWSIVRCVLAPVVLIAQVADISCWWLALVPHYGVYFAYSIMATGAVVGMGLSLQIVLSLLNMYGVRGKFAVLLLLFGGAAGLGFIGLKVIQPALDDERRKADERKIPIPTVLDVVQGPVPADVGQLEKLIMGPVKTDKTHLFNGKGTMAPAFFEKDGAGYSKRIAREPELFQQRDGERRAIRAWIRSEPVARAKSFEADSFPLPKELADQPITAEYLTDAKAVKVKSIIADRCVRCHAAGAEQEDYPMETYEQVAKYFAPSQKD